VNGPSAPRERLVAYFDRAARPSNTWLNYTDLVEYQAGYQNVDKGDLLLPVTVLGPGLWFVCAPLEVHEVQWGGDSLDIYVTVTSLPAFGELSGAQLMGSEFAFDPVPWPRRVPDAVARYLGVI
jgi:hypothetical protein